MNRLSKNELKYFASLLTKKHRVAEGLFISEGKRLVSEVIASDLKVEKIIVTDKFYQSNEKFLEEIKLKCADIILCGENDFGRISDTRSPQGIAAVTAIPELPKPGAFNQPVIVALTGVSDPGNIGTILRTGEWFGIAEFILDEGCVEVYNPKVVRSSMGAVFHTNIALVKKLEEILLQKKDEGYKVLTADINGKSINEFKISGKNIMVFASEAHGPSEEIINISDEIISIPGKGKVESLNVASAAAIFLSRIN
ncbi:MAG: RNA methyltransferase [Melioribacteraceae bacterium]|nr:MAG: RNA methyltransferase [Melioribacteraceae bacterium]